MTVQCCVCHRYRVNEEWRLVEADQADTSHTYCPSCFAEFLRDMEREEESSSTPTGGGRRRQMKGSPNVG